MAYNRDKWYYSDMSDTRLNQGSSSGNPAFSAGVKEVPKLTRKQRAFVEYILAHPEESNTKAALAAYPNVTYGTARQIAVDNMTKPSIVMALGEANDIVESTLTSVIKDWGASQDVQERSLAINTARYVHDKIHGKATQRTEVTSNVVSISLDLTSGSAGDVPQDVLRALEAS